MPKLSIGNSHSLRLDSFKSKDSLLGSNYDIFAVIHNAIIISDTVGDSAKVGVERVVGFGLLSRCLGLFGSRF